MGGRNVRALGIRYGDSLLMGLTWGRPCGGAWASVLWVSPSRSVPNTLTSCGTEPTGPGSPEPGVLPFSLRRVTELRWDPGLAEREVRLRFGSVHHVATPPPGCPLPLLDWANDHSMGLRRHLCPQGRAGLGFGQAERLGRGKSSRGWAGAHNTEFGSRPGCSLGPWCLGNKTPNL